MKKTGIPYHYIYILATFIAGILLLPHPLEAQVNEEELRSHGPVEFLNYEGPHSRIETRAQIRDIGYSLGQTIRAGTARTGALGRYFVINSVSPPDGFKLDADIFGLGGDVGVNHIRNLRLIIQGYLEGAYQYNESDAALLAEYITIYNAVYRGDWNFFSNRYKDPVLGHLSQERVGLSIRFDEWPGQTLMVIPLGTGLGGPLSAIDTSAINDSRVVDQLRQEPDMGLDQRRGMVDLMEREADHAAMEAAITREAISQEEDRIAREQELLRQQQEELALERQQPGADQQELDQRQEAVAQQQQELQQRTEELADQRQEAERQEAFNEQRLTETQQERQQIAQDQQAILNMPPAPQIASVLGISILNQDTALGRLVLIDNTGNITRQSPLNTVHTRTVTLINNRVYAVAGENRGSGAIRIVEINTETLEMQRQGDNDIAQGSLLWVNGQDIYAIISTDGNHNLARFNTDLVLQSRSSLRVHPLASVFFYGGFLITQGIDGSAALLNPGDLSERR
jgi:hypothetical protein